jgi:hypothetical protein
MIRRIVRRVFRLAGWLMTPMVIVAAAGAGAFLLALVAPRFSITVGLALVGVAGLVGAIVGLLLWMKLLRQSPELRQALAVTSDGVPEGKAVEEMFELDRPASGGGSP